MTTVPAAASAAVPVRAAGDAGLRSAAVDEQEVRVAAEITLALGAVAFVLANFEKRFVPIRAVSTFFAVDFLLRVTVGFQRSPCGIAARRLARRHEPQWVSAKPKRFAWTLGLVMSTAMAVITNSGIHGALPRTICLVCLALMWLESVLGLCLGCELYRVAVTRAWRTPDPGYEVCAGGACAVTGGGAPDHDPVTTGRAR